MKRIPFDIKYRPEIEAGKYKVVTEYGESVRIICWDSKFCNAYPVIALISDGDGEDIIHLNESGSSNNNSVRGEQLYVITDEPEELTEFEQRLVKFCNDRDALPHDKDGQHNRHDIHKLLLDAARELTAIAQSEFEKSQWIEDMQEWWYNKGHLEGYAKGQKDAEERHKEATSYRMPMMPGYPPCYWGGPCTNPHHDCINCPKQGAYQGISKTDTKVERYG